MKRCKCGKAIRGKYYAGRGVCKACAEKRSAELYDEAERVVSTGCCPDCKAPLKRNLALTGWWQCAGYGAVEMRAPEYRNLPACSFQTFTRGR